jgi:trehalose/maltose hydrolase-like predicted phosphorylase
MFIPTGPAPQGSDVEGDIIYLHEDERRRGSFGDSDIFYIAFPFDLPLGRDLLRRTYYFHRNLEIGRVSMGAVFHAGSAAAAGDRVGAGVFFSNTSQIMSEPVWGMGTEYTNATTTCFLTSMGGLLQVAMMAFTGLRFEPGNWAKYDACLPEGWEKIEIERIYLAGKPYRLEAVHGHKAVLTGSAQAG